MRSILDQRTEYDSFDLKDYDKEPMNLDEATRKAAILRLEHPEIIYRVYPADPETTSFKIVEMSKAQAWANFRINVLRLLSAFVR